VFNKTVPLVSDSASQTSVTFSQPAVTAPATGDTWYGDEYLFGPGTQYTKADCEYPFEMDASGDISGWTVDMTPQVNGNMNMKNISESEWK